MSRRILTLLVFIGVLLIAAALILTFGSMTDGIPPPTEQTPARSETTAHPSPSHTIAPRPTETPVAHRTETATPPPTATNTPAPTATKLSTATATDTPFPTVPTNVAILPPGGPGAATGLQSEPGCQDAQPIATLRWSLASRKGTAQRVDVATFIGGFEEGEFIAVGPFAPDKSSVIFGQAASGVLHYWRVLTLHPEGWRPSQTATFNGSFCVPDQVSSEP